MPFWHFTCILVRVYCILTNGGEPRLLTGAAVTSRELGGSYNQTFGGNEFQRQFLSNIRFILRIGTQAMEPAILWFERRIHRVKRLTSGKLLRPCGGHSKGGDYTAFRPTF